MMNARQKEFYESEISAARKLIAEGKIDDAFSRLEVAHVLGQHHVLPHVKSHWLMLKIGVKRRSAYQVFGQAVRMMVGAIGSAVGIVPAGNTGGTNISMFRRLPIAPELNKILNEK
ncbi:MAG: DUF3703 domain-containing protein [Pseudomonadota bacterium]